MFILALPTVAYSLTSVSFCLCREQSAVLKMHRFSDVLRLVAFYSDVHQGTMVAQMEVRTFHTVTAKAV